MACLEFIFCVLCLKVPEMLRMPLTELCLQIKSLHLGDIKSFLLKVSSVSSLFLFHCTFLCNVPMHLFRSVVKYLVPTYIYIYSSFGFLASQILQ
jgi:hypothetical protein